MTALSDRADIPALIRECFGRIQKGSKSFSLAARLYPKRVRARAFLLYAWCRFCDDAIDEAPDLESQRRQLALLFERTAWALRPETDFTAKDASEPDAIPFTALALVARASELPVHYPFELLEGMAMDLRGERYLSLEDLERYCFRVAGVVGLQMTYAMGVTDPRAFPHAVALGNAMQLTNIARDVGDDFRLGRVYLPLGWLGRAGTAPEEMLRPSMLPKTAEVVGRLLDAAEARYAVGLRGLPYLPWRCALAVGVAACVYRQIGRQVRARGAAAWETRTVVSPLRKFRCVVEGIALVMMQGPRRWAYLRKGKQGCNSDVLDPQARMVAPRLAMDLS